MFSSSKILFFLLLILFILPITPGYTQGWDDFSRELPALPSYEETTSSETEEFLSKLNQNLQAALDQYKNIQARGGWPMISAGSRLELGDKGRRVNVLRKRLMASGDLDSGVPEGPFDEEVKQAVKFFQKRHGLDEDGKVGWETLHALNVPLIKRKNQIWVAMERLRRLPKDLGKRFILVNVPDFSLAAFDQGKWVLDSKVIVGQKKDWQTPLFSSRITKIVLNPKWRVPPNIVKQEYLDVLQDNPDYLAMANMKLYEHQGEDWVELDPKIVDWETVDVNNIRLVQQEGTTNPMGQIKFQFYNPFDIYLHDTPNKNLFLRRVKTFSHGCIRVEKPMELVRFFLAGEEDWNEEKIGEKLKEGTTQTISLNAPVDIHILYQTVWVDDNGLVNFRDDIYNLDNRVWNEMMAKNAIGEL